MIWHLIGLWAQQLRNAKPLSERGRFARFSVLTLVVLFVPFSCFAVYLGMRGGYEGPTMTDAGLVMPAILAITALVDLKLLPTALRRRTLRAGVALMLALLYAWTDGSYQAQSKHYQDRETGSSEKTSTEPGVVSFSFPFVSQPQTVEGLALHIPALLIAELPGFFVNNPRANPVLRVLRAVIVWAYWFSIFSLLGPRQSGASRTFRKVRPWLRGICASVCVLAFLAWLAGNSAHGPSPSFGFMFGTLIPI